MVTVRACARAIKANEPVVMTVERSRRPASILAAEVVGYTRIVEPRSVGISGPELEVVQNRINELALAYTETGFV